ncbi:MAG: endonuclease domain-containing protein [Thermomicrobiales bacterium]
MAKKAVVERAREFRAAPTQSEAMLWEVLRDRQLNGVKFRRQWVIGPFVVDFCAPRERFIIEIDGGIHDTLYEYDEERQRWLETARYHIVRVSALDVETDLFAVLSILSKHLRSPSPSPS